MGRSSSTIGEKKIDGCLCSIEAGRSEKLDIGLPVKLPSVWTAFKLTHEESDSIREGVGGVFGEGWDMISYTPVAGLRFLRIQGESSQRGVGNTVTTPLLR